MLVAMFFTRSGPETFLVRSEADFSDGNPWSGLGMVGCAIPLCCCMGEERDLAIGELN